MTGVNGFTAIIFEAVESFPRSEKKSTGFLNKDVSAGAEAASAWSSGEVTVSLEDYRLFGCYPRQRQQILTSFRISTTDATNNWVENVVSTCVFARVISITKNTHQLIKVTKSVTDTSKEFCEQKAYFKRTKEKGNSEQSKAFITNALLLSNWKKLQANLCMLPSLIKFDVAHFGYARSTYALFDTAKQAVIAVQEFCGVMSSNPMGLKDWWWTKQCRISKQIQFRTF